MTAESVSQDQESTEPVAGRLETAINSLDLRAGLAVAALSGLALSSGWLQLADRELDQPLEHPTPATAAPAQEFQLEPRPRARLLKEPTEDTALNLFQRIDFALSGESIRNDDIITRFLEVNSDRLPIGFQITIFETGFADIQVERSDFTTQEMKVLALEHSLEQLEYSMPNLADQSFVDELLLRVFPVVEEPIRNPNVDSDSFYPHAETMPYKTFGWLEGQTLSVGLVVNQPFEEQDIQSQVRIAVQSVGTT